MKINTYKENQKFPVLTIWHLMDEDIIEQNIFKHKQVQTSFLLI